MGTEDDFTTRLEAKVKEQLGSQRVGYLLGAGSSYLDGNGYPLAFELWDRIKDSITDTDKRGEIQAKLDDGAEGIEHALDLLDDGGVADSVHRHLVTAAIANHFLKIVPPLDLHAEFVTRIAHRTDTWKRVFSLNYDPLIERAADHSRTRLVDGFLGTEHAYFEPAVFEERIGRIRSAHRSRQFEPTAVPVQLLNLHGSLGWFEPNATDARRGSFDSAYASDTKRLMVPPQRRKAADTMAPPYSALWSRFRGCLAHNDAPINRLVCIGYGFADSHVNEVIEPALARNDFTLLIFTKSLTESAWDHWSAKDKAIVVTEARCSLYGDLGPGHRDLWSFEHLAKEI